LRFLERLTGVEEPNISSWRRQNFGDMTSVFRFNAASSTPPSLPDTGGPLILSRFEQSQLPAPVVPPATQQPPPPQEPGPRKHLP
jgi:phospholipase C